MPVYEYECPDCGKQFEVFQSIKDNPLKTCKFCKGTLRRLISQSSFSLKGGGWYQDGYHKSPPKEKKESGKGGGKAKDGQPAKKKTDTPSNPN